MIPLREQYYLDAVKDGKPNRAQVELLKQLVGHVEGEFDPNSAYGHPHTMTWYCTFKAARNEKINDKTKNRYKGAEA